MGWLGRKRLHKVFFLMHSVMTESSSKHPPLLIDSSKHTTSYHSTYKTYTVPLIHKSTKAWSMTCTPCTQNLSYWPPFICMETSSVEPLPATKCVDNRPHQHGRWILSRWPAAALTIKCWGKLPIGPPFSPILHETFPLWACIQAHNTCKSWQHEGKRCPWATLDKLGTDCFSCERQKAYLPWIGASVGQ